MAFLLPTKFYPPAIPSGFVARPQLSEKLDEALARRLTLVSAPAGAGKTTLVSAWAQSAYKKGTSFGWLSLDEEDNALERFLEYLVACLETSGAELETGTTSFQEGSQAARESVPVSILRALVNLKRDFMLILDDYHLISNHEVHAVVGYLLAHMPPRLHLALLTRSDPPLELARLRVAGQLVELRMEHLRFSAPEASVFLRKNAGVQLAEEDVAALNTRTEGWIAGLQMAALSLHKHPNAREFIAAFTGSNRYIFDYLLEEVLQKQPLAIQEFLLKTSILDRLCAPLCDFILERNDSQPVLAKLEQDNLFLLPLDEERRWYRYHHLFAQLLQVRMERSGSGSKALHARASLWLEAQGLHTDALNHALKAGDPQRASNLAEEHALSMLGQGHLGTLTSWLETLPEEIVNNRPWLCVAQGLPAVYAGRLEVAERCANRAEAQLESGTLTLSTAERAHIQGFVALIRSTAAGLNIDYENAERYANLALDLIPADDLAGRAMAYTMLGTCSRHEGKLLQAVAALETAGCLADESGNNLVKLLAHNNRIGLQVYRGKLRQSIAEYLALFRSMESVHPATAMIGSAFLSLGRVYLKQNNLSQARQYIQEGLAISEQWGQSEFILSGMIDLAEVQCAEGDRQEALDSFARARQLSGEISWPTWVQAMEVNMHYLAGDSTAMLRWAHDFDARADSPELNLPNAAIYLTLARAWVVEEKWPEARRLLQRIWEVVGSSEVLERKLETLVLSALAERGNQNHKSSLEILETALMLAEPEGYVRVFLNENLVVMDLLRAIPPRSPARKYAQHILSEFVRAEAGKSLVAQSDLAEPLSEREVEILALLNSPLTTLEIAAQLILSKNTVRTHIKNIFAKLGVHGRSAAVKRARDLGLLK